MKKATIFLVFIIGCTISFMSCSEEEENNLPILNLEVGQFYQGGIIFYIDSTGQHGLIAAEQDQTNGEGIPWACHGAFYDILESELGFGEQNTHDIINNITQDETCSPQIYAAKICNDLVLEGYSDWFLPSYEELNLIYENRDLIGNFNDSGNFSNSFYWSSNEWNNIWARVRFFGTNPDFIQYNNSGKDNLHNVRAIRKF